MIFLLFCYDCFDIIKCDNNLTAVNSKQNILIRIASRCCQTLHTTDLKLQIESCWMKFLIMHSCHFLEQITFYMNLWMIFIFKRFHGTHRYWEIKSTMTVFLKPISLSLPALRDQVIKAKVHCELYIAYG